MRNKMDRRSFLATSALGATALGLASRKIYGTSAAKVNYDNASDKITVGMIAVGARAVDLIEGVNNCEGTEIVAVCDAYKGRVERAIERIGGRVKAYKDYREIISNKDIDAVVISSPDHLHAHQMIDAMNAGKHVYIEKPLTYTVEEGIEIVKAAKRNKVAVQVGSTGVSSALSAKAKEIVASGKLGQITMLRAYNNRNSTEGAWLYPIPPDASKETVNWSMFLGPAPKRPFDLARFFRWRCYKDYSGGIPTDLFVHLCNSIHYIMGVDMCKSAMAMGGLYRWKESRDVADTINASLEYPQGFMVNITSTFNNQKGSGSSLTIHGTEGTLEFGGEKLVFTPEIIQDNHGWVVRSWPSDLEKQYYDDPENKFREQSWTRPSKALDAGEIFVSEGIDATTVHFREFFDAVRKGTTTKEDAVVGHHAAACAHMVNMSIEQGKIVHWDADNDTIKA
jgi:predicted dehydrogenase